MGRPLSWLTGMMLVTAVVGCQDKVAEENRALHTQNGELQKQSSSLQQQLDDAKRQQAATPPPAPTPPVVLVQPTTPPPTLPPEKIVKPGPDLGDLERTEDVKAGTTTVTLPGDVFFDPGQDKIKDSAKGSLDKVVAALKKEYGGKTAKIIGYTDSDPIKHSHWKSNQELSESRASAVRDYLVKMGIDASRLSIQGLGDAKPMATKALSRRVEVVVITR